MGRRRRNAVAVVLALLAALLTATVAPPAGASPAEGCDNGEYACGDGDGGWTSGGEHQDGGSGDSGGGSGGGGGPSGPVYEYRYVPACMANGAPSPDANGYMTGADALCASIFQACVDQGGGLLTRIYRREVGTVGPWDLVSTECRGPDEEEEPVPVPPEIVAEIAWEHTQPPPVQIQAEPGAGGLVNLASHFRAEGATTLGPVTSDPFGGTVVQLRASIDRVEWAFGDGTGAQGLEVAHDYRDKGSFTVTVTTVWTAEWSTDGATWATVLDNDGTIAERTATDSLTFPVREVRTVITD